MTLLKRGRRTWAPAVVRLLPLRLRRATGVVACAHNPVPPGPPNPSTGSPSPSCNLPLWVGWIEWKYELSYHDTVGTTRYDQDYMHTVRWELNGTENTPCNANIAQSSYTGHTYSDEDTPQALPGAAGCDSNAIYEHYKNDWDVVNPVEDQLSITEDANSNVLISTRSVNNQRPIGSSKIDRTFRECGQPGKQTSDRNLLRQATLDLILSPVPAEAISTARPTRKRTVRRWALPWMSSQLSLFPFRS